MSEKSKKGSSLEHSLQDLGMDGETMEKSRRSEIKAKSTKDRKTADSQSFDGDNGDNTENTRRSSWEAGKETTEHRTPAEDAQTGWPQRAACERGRCGIDTLAPRTSVGKPSCQTATGLLVLESATKTARVSDGAAR